MQVVYDNDRVPDCPLISVEYFMYFSSFCAKLSRTVLIKNPELGSGELEYHFGVSHQRRIL